MRTLVLGPDDVREALDPRNHPKRHVFLVSVEGDVICCDLDGGWVRFTKPPHIRHKDWSTVLKAAISHMQHYIFLTKNIHDNLLEDTEPRPIPANIFVHEKGSCPKCGEQADPGMYPYCSEAHKLQSPDH